jgi:PAS domain S-box-containing protein
MKAIKTKEAQKEALHMRIGNGELRWILFSSQPLPDDHLEGGSCSAVTQIIDVTNEKLLTARVEKKKSLINAFIRQTPNLAWVVDEDTRLVFASSAFCQQFGLDEQDCLDRPMAELVPPIVYSALYEKHMTVFNTGRAVKTSERVMLADGTNYVSHINIFPVEIIKGKKMVGGYAVNLPDTTRIEGELREANQRLLTLTKAAANAIWEWDMQSGKIFRNEILMKMIGYQQDDSKGFHGGSAEFILRTATGLAIK